MYRQGDVLIMKCDDIPTDTKLIKEDKEIVLAHGEATGHKHAIYTPEKVNAFSANDENLYLEIIKPVNLLHEEHTKIKLPVGNYKVIRQREYKYGESYRVAD